MIQQIRKSKVTKVVSMYLAMMMLLEILAPMSAYALTGGPGQPEFNSFTPIGTSDMVDLSSGDFSYNIPIMDVGGYPINLAYSSNVSMDQEASWVGLGWDLSIGQINRQVRGIPDDFDGDEMTYENSMKENITVGGKLGASLAFIGIGENGEKGGGSGSTINNSGGSPTGGSGGSPTGGSGGSPTGGSGGSPTGGSGSSPTGGSGSSPTGPSGGSSGGPIRTTDLADGLSVRLSASLGVTLNNYTGFDHTIDVGANFGYPLLKSLSIDGGIGISSSGSNGPSISSTVGLGYQMGFLKNKSVDLGLNMGTSYSSRRGMESISINRSLNLGYEKARTGESSKRGFKGGGGLNFGSSISFVDASYTPSRRATMLSECNTYSAMYTGEMWGVEPGPKLTGFKSKQFIPDNEKITKEKAYGYQNTFKATRNDIVDFNREKDRPFSKNTKSLPLTNYTYDIYTVQGQGVGGTFRPYSNQVGYIYDRQVNDNSKSKSLGLEFGLTSPNFKFGVDVDIVKSNSHTGLWENNNNILPKLREIKSGNRPDYEKIYFKNIGVGNIDADYANSFRDKIGGYNAVRNGVDGKDYSASLASRYEFKSSATGITPIDITSPIKRTNRALRGQVIQKLTRKEATKYGFGTIFSKHCKPYIHDHHTSEIRIIKEGGERYVYGRAAYNIKKKEVTFDVSGRSFNGHSGIVTYGAGDNSIKNNAGGDHYFNAITTPAYAHTYLLTSVLSNDYSDLTGNGPSDDDLGSYTKFVYNSKTGNTPYKWRMPYGNMQANYDEGLKSSKKDDKGSYIYGEKELLYIDTIVTKTHIAIFEISKRKDGYGVVGENGGGAIGISAPMYKLDKIKLYSKPEFIAKGANAIPIKTANFVYDYSLCKNVPNNFTGTLTSNEISNDRGKLTLKKVYFTYGKSNMGKYTPYEFSYVSAPADLPDNYDPKAFDSWGNYKPNDPLSGTGALDTPTNGEFPFTEQTKSKADFNNTKWLLNAVDLPSGGRLAVNYESDDYAYVQDKEVMQMFKVTGVGVSSDPGAAYVTNTNLYGDFYTDIDINPFYIYIKLTGANDDVVVNNINSDEDLIKHYIKQLTDNPVYFRFLLNMAPPGTYQDRYDYVTGYMKFAGEYKLRNYNGIKYACIKVEKESKGDGFSSSNFMVNPISRAGWEFGRQYLNNLVYNHPSDEVTDDLGEILTNIVRAYSNIKDIFKCPNGLLYNSGIAKKFVAGKAWVRLMNPAGRKFGGGSRVKSIKIYDNWDVMTNHNGDDIYSEYYGQEYSYDDESANTSGVAAYEPLGNKENPFVQPFYDARDRTAILGPDLENYVEKPFGEMFFPSPRITYGTVTVKNIARESSVNNTAVKVKRHATGKVVTKFFTTKDYPTLTEMTDMVTRYKSGFSIKFPKGSTKTHLTLSQGYTIHINDMDGKMKGQYVYAEDKDDNPISKTEYIYDVSPSTQTSDAANNIKGKLNNEVTTIDPKGNVSKRVMGVDYDCINDFRESYIETGQGGVSANIAVNSAGPFVVTSGTFLPNFSDTESLARTAVVTKVINSIGILREQRVFDGDSNVYTRNLAWDANTGEVLVTETINEFNDKYYTFNYPAYWAYDLMGQSAQNIGTSWEIDFLGGENYSYRFSGALYKAKDYLTEGDELWVEPYVMNYDESREIFRDEIKAYVVKLENNLFTLITEDGKYITKDQVDKAKITVIRSGRRNLATAGMASITSMVNPLDKVVNGKLPNDLFKSSNWSDYRIVNASAIQYQDEWAAQCECNLPKMKYDNNGKLTFNYKDEGIFGDKTYNPYKYNVKGNWRPNKSYAYLTSRNVNPGSVPNTNDNILIRTSGYYNNFMPFYVFDPSLNKWSIFVPDNATDQQTRTMFNKWKFASEITQYNPYGFEVENKDALGIYSAAIYGYNYRFPVAVSSNAKYSQIASDGFEDYDFNHCGTEAHFSVEGSIVPNQVYTTKEQSHTGKKSLKVSPGKKASIVKQIKPCPPASGN
ncbi:hypothetical protein ACLI08_13300 [Flavobacterium sp. RNTU_13]|uniref:hypothetical protein n=1 Tax=Flavobacterium sp. RNTU_13 TaxID=3375145 RepID=UPI0039886745